MGIFTIRKQVLLTKEQHAFLLRLKKKKGESVGHYLREALEEYAQTRGMKIGKK